MKIKVNNKMLKEFLYIMGDWGEPVFGSKEEIKKQLETCLNFQGYWSGNYIRIFYDNNTNNFSIQNRF